MHIQAHAYPQTILKYKMTTRLDYCLCEHEGNFPLYCLEVPPSVMLPHAARFLVQLHAPLCRLLGSHLKIVYCAQVCQVLDLNLNLNLNVNLNLNFV